MKSDGEGGKGNNNGDALLPTLPTVETPTHEPTMRQRDEEKNDGIQMKDAVAAPEKVNDDKDKTEKLKGIVEKILDEHSEPRFRTNWGALHYATRVAFLGVVLDACKKFSNRDHFDAVLRSLFNSIFKDDDGALAEFVSTVYKQCLHQGLIIVEVNKFTERVVSITHGLDQKFLGSFDLEELDKHIDTVFKWHEGGHVTYRSPSFAMVQSSGMGKTKLMREYKEKCKKNDSGDMECKMILCMDQTQEGVPDFDNHFDGKLVMRLDNGFNQNNADDIKQQLREIERKCRKKKVVFFFDEAQKLKPEASTGAYHTVLWWLRQVRDDARAYVGVFAGTLLGLSKFQFVQAPSGFSRDSQPTYKNYNKKTEEKLRLYDPFCSLTTISVARSNKKKDAFVDELKDIRKYGCNGRPLFAAMLRKQGSAYLPALTLSDANFPGGVMTNPTMYNILRRVLLSPNPIDWANNDDSIASVLGMRVQLGLANYDFVNKATSSGYAMLVRYDTPKSEQDQMKNFGSVSIVFPPDPVCAALAMGMMQPGWILRKNAVDPAICGKEPKFWVDKIASLFDQSLFLPNRCDSGEVFAALYMLLCGDALRRKEDLHMRLFEVDLQEWLQELQSTPEIPEAPKNPKAPKRPKLQPTAVRDTPRLSTKEKAQARIDSGVTTTLDIGVKMIVEEKTERMNKDKCQGTMASMETTGCTLTLNFIQVCRNYFRSHAWLSRSMLEHMYETATGCYVYPQCPAVDIVFPIKQVTTKDGNVSYHPCLVSVKCWDSITLSEMKTAKNSMRDYLQDRPTNGVDEMTSALCIVLVIGTTSSPKTSPQSEWTFPNEDTYISIVVPSRDKFGVNETIKNMAGASHISELLASHAFAYTEKDESALRVTATTDYHALGKRLLADKQQLWKDQNKTN